MSGDDPASPCTAICILDPVSGLCRGCWRTIEEIMAWPSLSAEEKRRILAGLPGRRPRSSLQGN